MNELAMKFFIKILLLAPLVYLTCYQSQAAEIALPGVASDWPAYGATVGGSHFSRANQIAPTNVSSIESRLASSLWRFS
jgi:glucose dehydrogenase